MVLGQFPDTLIKGMNTSFDSFQASIDCLKVFRIRCISLGGEFLDFNERIELSFKIKKTGKY